LEKSDTVGYWAKKFFKGNNSFKFYVRVIGLGKNIELLLGKKVSSEYFLSCLQIVNQNIQTVQKGPSFSQNTCHIDPE
jgi:hypothetical protein